MQIGMIGLGRMGSNLAKRLVRDHHECVVFDVNPTAVEQLSESGIVGASSIAHLVAMMARPRSIWIMLPAGVSGDTISELSDLLDQDDTIIDGGNSYYRDDIERARSLKERGIHHVDCGTSGGVFGLERGFCLMIGGETEVVARLDPVFKSIAPGIQAAPRTPGRQGVPASAEEGYLHCGSNGAGHFVKMVHNGIEYGLMAAYAEGLNVLKNANFGNVAQRSDAETTPLRDPDFYKYDIDISAVAEVWRRGSVVASWLLDLTAEALSGDTHLEEFSGHVSDSGEGRWTVLAAIDEGVPAPVISAALYSRFESRGDADYADRLLSAMRKQFGGHDERKP